jgi:uncharacterized membrane protein
MDAKQNKKLLKKDEKVINDINEIIKISIIPLHEFHYFISISF